jgi:hypothetical protein
LYRARGATNKLYLGDGGEELTEKLPQSQGGMRTVQELITYVDPHYRLPQSASWQELCEELDRGLRRLRESGPHLHP